MPGDDSVWQELRKKIIQMKAENLHVRVGVMKSTGGSAEKAGGITLTELAAIHEFGSPAAGIPERSFIRRTFTDKHHELVEMSTKIAKALLNDRVDPDKALKIFGMWAATEVKKTIVEQRVRPKLEESAAGRRTIARKGSSVTLVDTGQLLNSVGFEVTGEK